jgi:enoyl-CoA hydratase
MKRFSDLGTPRAFAEGRMLAAQAGGIGLVTFNQPEKRNAISVEMWQGLADILQGMEADPAVRVVILTGAGDQAFVSGADISQFDKQRGDHAAQRDYAARIQAGRDALRGFGKPMIAAIRGYCLGGGLAIAMAADLRLAGTGSRFGIPAARLGIAYGFEGLRLLVSLIGPARARMLLFSARRIGAEEAERIGLINQAVPDDALEAEALALAGEIAQNAPLAIQAARLGIAAVLQDPAQRDLARLEALAATCADSADYREGRTAFMEKRLPRFTGR